MKPYIFTLSTVILFNLSQPLAAQKVRRGAAAARELQQQQSITLQPKVYENYILPDATVRVQDESGQISKVPIDEIRINDRAKTVGYASTIKTVDEDTKQKLESKLSSTSLNIGKMKVIPELHLATITNEGKTKSYRVMFNSELPLRYDASKGTFGSTISFLLAEEPVDAVNSTLEEPIFVEVTSNTIRTITPNNINLNHLYTPSSNVELADTQVKDSALIRIITRFNPSGYETYVQVKPALQLSCARGSVQGLGIQEVPVTVRYVGSSSSDQTTVSIQAEKGKVTPDIMTLKYNETKTIMLRSEGIGESTITALSNDQESKIVVPYIFPWLFLFLSLGGGLLGALIKVLGSRRKIKFKPLLYGMLIGLLGACVYYVLGLNLLHLEVSKVFNETAVCAFAVLCSYFGIRKEKEATA